MKIVKVDLREEISKYLKDDLFFIVWEDSKTFNKVVPWYYRITKQCKLDLQGAPKIDLKEVLKHSPELKEKYIKLCIKNI